MNILIIKYKGVFLAKPKQELYFVSYRLTKKQKKFITIYTEE